MRTGRPKKVHIDKKQFEACISIPYIQKKDLGKIFLCSEDTIERYIKKEYKLTYADLKEQKNLKFRRAVIGKQYEVAMKGNVSMLIWLGKNYCHQTDTPAVAVENKTFNMSYSKEDVRSEIEKRRAQNEKETKEAKGQEIINGVKIGSDQINT